MKSDLQREAGSQSWPTDLSAHRKKQFSKKECMLCGIEFRTHSRTDYFCRSCKIEDELYQTQDWASDTRADKASA
jgi:hypothetical protein